MADKRTPEPMPRWEWEVLTGKPYPKDGDRVTLLVEGVYQEDGRRIRHQDGSSTDIPDGLVPEVLVPEPQEVTRVKETWQRFEGKTLTDSAGWGAAITLGAFAMAVIDLCDRYSALLAERDQTKEGQAENVHGL